MGYLVLSKNISDFFSMKKSRKRVLWETRHSKKMFQRTLLSKEKRKQKFRAINRARHRRFAEDIKGPSESLYIDCAERLDLGDGIEDTLRLVQQIRSKRMKSSDAKFHIAIEHIEFISPGAALLIASVLDRRRILSLNRASYEARTSQDWDPNVTKLLQQIGFLSLLGVKNIAFEPDNEPSTKTDFLSMQRGIGAEGKKARRLRQQLNELAGVVSNPPKLFGALTEAMTNTRHHAYSGTGTIQHWWLSASYDRDTNWMTVMFVDHGLGIPKTLPKKHRSYFRRMVPRFSTDLTRRDSQIIEAAMELGVSSASGRTRGKGLKKNIQGYIEQNECHGRLRIVSRRGYYRFEKQAGGTAEVATRSLKGEFLGTLIEWGFEVKPDEC